MLQDDSNAGVLRRLFDVAVRAADPMAVIPQKLPNRPKGRVIVLGAGKASARMAEAVETIWPDCQGLVITRYGYTRPCRSIEIVAASHPIPDAAGVTATQRILDYAHSATADDLVLALISGGASALLTAPAGDITLAQKQAVNSALLRAGAPIGQMNILRKHLSAVKGGQLAAAAYPAQLLTLAISDVPGDDLGVIGSGPTVGEASTAQDALDIAHRWGIELPNSALQVLGGETGVIAPNDHRLVHSAAQIIAAPSQSLHAAADLARSLGFEVEIWGDAIEGEARVIANDHAARARAIQNQLPKGKKLIALSGGELTVTQTGTGIGGPNAEYVLAMGLALHGQQGIYALSCDTDGVDGAADVAGAIITPRFMEHSHGQDPERALENNDAHGFFDKIGGQIMTGPTFTNVNDFRAILIEGL